MSFGTGGLFVNESVTVARLHLSGEQWDLTLERAIADGAASLPKAASNRRTLREICKRVASLTDEERNFLIDEAERPDQEALLWLSMCRTYRFVREFFLEVVQERYLSFRLDLPLEAFDSFLDAKAEWDDGLAGLSQMTRLKLRQILFRIMREAGILDKGGQIRQAYLSSRLRSLIATKNSDEFLYFPGLRKEETAS
jgi:hypothetical protein